MRATLLAVPRSVSAWVEERLREETGLAVECDELARQGGWEVPAVLPSGLLVLWDEGGALDEALGRCRQVHARRVAERTHLVVLTSRGPSEACALAEAGADECLAPPGSHWGARWVALGRRLDAEVRRRRAHAELERTRDFLRSALDTVPDPLLVKDRAHRWLAFNEAFCRLLGRRPEELLGHTDHDFVPAREADAFWRQDERAFRTGQPVECEESLTGEAGQARTLITKKAVFVGAGGEPFLVALTRDVTEHRRLEERLRLAERMASVGTLAAGVAHEINNPLAYVCSNLSFLAEQLSEPRLAPEDVEDMRAATAEAQEGTRRVRAIVQDLRTFARADDERLGPVDVQRALEGALRLVRLELQQRARLVRQYAPVPAVLGSEGRLGQVLVNLLVNAVQALPARPLADNEVRVATRQAGPGWVEVEVADNGCGMAPEVQRRIFDPFFTTKPVGEGTGLGLAICHGLVQAMGGLIEVSSEPGRGTSFRLRLPACGEAHAPPPAAG